MLHTNDPSVYVEQLDTLNKKWLCCECNSEFVFGNGFVFLSHYKARGTGEVGVGLMCFCSMECGLGFEHQSFMGSC